MATEQSTTPAYLTLGLPANASDMIKLSGLISNIMVGQERYADLTALRSQFEEWINSYKEQLTSKKAEIDAKIVVSTKEQYVRQKYETIHELQEKISNAKENIKAHNNILNSNKRALTRYADQPENLKETNEKIKQVEDKLAKFRERQTELEKKLHDASDNSDNNNYSEMKEITRDMLEELYDNIMKIKKQIQILNGEYADIQSRINELIILENKVNHMITHSLLV